MKSFWESGTLFSKSGRRPHPLHGQSDAVLLGASSQKFVFFASFYRILVKRVLAAGGRSGGGFRPDEAVDGEYHRYWLLRRK
jgi:hypothetical protein